MVVVVGDIGGVAFKMKIINFKIISLKNKVSILLLVIVVVPAAKATNKTKNTRNKFKNFMIKM